MANSGHRAKAFFGGGMTTAEIQNLIVETARRYGLDERIALAQIRQESGFNPRAVGPQTRYGTAKGLAQFIDATARKYGISDPFDPRQAMEGWGKYMTYLLKFFGGRYDLALAGYNWGENRAELIKAAKEGLVFPTPSAPKQTRDYVAIILRNAGRVQTPVTSPAQTTNTAAPRTAAPSSAGLILVAIVLGFALKR